MEVNIKLEFDNAKELQRMIDFTWKIECPMKDIKCTKDCLYHKSCLKFREICKRLEIVETYESKHNL